MHVKGIIAKNWGSVCPRSTDDSQCMCPLIFIHVFFACTHAFSCICSDRLFDATAIATIQVQALSGCFCGASNFGGRRCRDCNKGCRRSTPRCKRVEPHACYASYMPMPTRLTIREPFPGRLIQEPRAMFLRSAPIAFALWRIFFESSDREWLS